MRNEKRPVCGGIHRGVMERETCGMYVRGKIGDMEIEMLIDSGANISIVDYQVYQNMPGRKPKLRSYGIPMVTADGTPMKVYGCADFAFEIGDETCSYEYTMCIADIGVEAILGYDFLKKQEAIIDMGRSLLELKDIPCTGPDGDHVGECNIIIGRNIMVPAGGEAVAQGYCVGGGLDFIGMLEVKEKFRQKKCMLIACAVVRAGPQGVPVRVFNVGSEPITIYKNTMIATCREVEVMQAGKNEGPSRSTELPEHLNQLYQEGCVNLTAENQEKLCELLTEYQDVFSAHDLDMGRTGLIQHSIDTRDAHPVKQRLRRVPIHLKGVVKDEVKKLMDRGLIEPSMSPWASSLVLVKKKLLDKNGSIQYRVCIDYRPLNEVTIKDSFPTPRCETCLDALFGSRWYCCMDLMSGYHQVEMHEEDREKLPSTRRKACFNGV